MRLTLETQRRWLIPKVRFYRGRDAKHSLVFKRAPCNLHPNRQTFWRPDYRHNRGGGTQ